MLWICGEDSVDNCVLGLCGKVLDLGEVKLQEGLCEKRSGAAPLLDIDSSSQLENRPMAGHIWAHQSSW